MFLALLLDMHQNIFIKITDARVSLNSIDKIVGSHIHELFIRNQQAKNGQLSKCESYLVSFSHSVVNYNSGYETRVSNVVILTRLSMSWTAPNSQMQ